MGQMMTSKRKKPANEFEAEKVFEVQPAYDLELDRESGTYTAEKGQGGDRRG